MNINNSKNTYHFGSSCRSSSWCASGTTPTWSCEGPCCPPRRNPRPVASARDSWSGSSPNTFCTGDSGSEEGIHHSEIQLDHFCSGGGSECGPRSLPHLPPVWDCGRSQPSRAGVRTPCVGGRRTLQQSTLPDKQTVSSTRREGEHLRF